jgi:hypothetical protein
MLNIFFFYLFLPFIPKLYGRRTFFYSYPSPSVPTFCCFATNSNGETPLSPVLVNATHYALPNNQSKVKFYCPEAIMLLVYFIVCLLVLQLQYLTIEPTVKAVTNVTGNGLNKFARKLQRENFVQAKKALTFKGQIELETLPISVGITFTGATAGDQLGLSVCVGGDINGDSKADILLGAPGYSSSTGRVYAIYGAASLSSLDMSSFSGGITITGTAASLLGIKVDIGGDANSDGVADMLVGATGFNTNSGAAYVIYGGASLGNIDTSSLAGAAGVTLSGGPVNTLAGYGLSLNYDHTPDGVADPVVGGYGYNVNQGRTYLVLGSEALTSTSFSTLPDAQFLTGPVGAGTSGFSVDSGGDINADLKPDLMIGSPETAAGGTVSVLFGGADWTNIANLALNPGVGFTITGPATGCLTGWDVSLGGDVNGDGKSDMLIGAPGCSSNAGIVYLVYGSASPASFTLSGSMSQGVSFIGATVGDQVGSSVAVGGDFNGDGKADMLIGAPGYSSNTGVVYLIYGSASLTNLALAVFSGSNGIKFTGEYGGCYTGHSVSLRGDVNGDSKADILIGASGYASNKGKVYLIYGTSIPMGNIVFDTESSAPTYQPSKTPTTVPTLQPTRVPTAIPTKTPTAFPTFAPSQPPTFLPTGNCFFVYFLLQSTFFL